MADLTYDILSLFKGDPSVELSTSDFAEMLFPVEFSSYMDVLSNEYSSKPAITDAKASIAKLQRKLLHHITKLVNSGSLSVSRIEGKGKKFFSLGISLDEELIVDKKSKRIVLTKPANPSLPLQDLEEKNIAYLVEKETFFQRVNAILLQSTKFDDLTSASEYMLSLLSEINDVLAINDFEHFINVFSLDSVFDFLDKLGKETSAYNKRICCIIDFTNIEHPDKVLSFFTTYFTALSKTVHFVFDVTGRELIQHDVLIKQLITVYSQSNEKLNIKNDDLHNSPYFLGKAGPYTISSKQWKTYLKSESSYPGIVCSQSSIVVDISSIKDINSSAKYMSDVLLQVSKSLFISNTFQQKFSLQLHNKMRIVNSGKLSGLFSYSKNYLRFWNYQSYDDTLLLPSLDSCKKDVVDFSHMQETIYLSSGMPTNFVVGFALAYRQFANDLQLKEQFTFLELSQLTDLYNTQSKELISLYESAAKIFTDGFEVRFKRVGVIETLAVLQELSHIINSCRFPFFCYHFSEPVGANKKLDSFI